MQGSKMLKVTGVLMIVLAAISLVLAILAVTAITALLAWAGAGGAAIGVAVMGVVVSFLSVILELVAGIMGVKNWNNPAKAKGCVIIGIIIIVFTVINAISNFTAPDANIGSAVFSLLVGLVIPGLYTYGALQLKKQG